jgi:hypothetical protein
MSDGKVRAAIEQMEAWMADPAWSPDAAALARWNAGFLAAMAEAGKSAGWADLMARAHAAGRELEARTARMAQTQEGVRAELKAQERGNRALRGYGASAR